MSDEKLLESIKKLYELSHSTHHLLHQYISKSTKYPLSPPQFWLLRLLEKHGTCTPSDVAQTMGVTSGAVTSLADRLYKQELITRERSKKDRRVVELSLTTKGKEIIELLSQERLSQLSEVCSRLSEEDISNTIHFYSKINNILEELLSEEQRGE